MISYLRGKIINKVPSAGSGQAGFVILLVGDIGYKAHINAPMYADLKIGQEAEIYTHQYVREDALDLYGFQLMEELEMFELLLSISGIGPKSALGVLSVGNVEAVKDSIAHGDPTLLTKVSGIGRKTAERVILELREKVGSIIGNRQKAEGSQMATGDEIDALMALGYSVQQARDALRQVDPKLKDSGERIKEALRRLGK
ncbi:Holliday junction branch migration protein RuvA [Candidatus Falkowbacteria bacterium]|nr:Holliday junction branch migration protein RuvA [Candidatus Falkowbacteria bacterium]